MFHMRDEAGGDDKILCIPAGDPRKNHIREIEDVSSFDRLEIQHFFETYKDLEPGKSVEGAHWAGREDAERCIDEAIERAREAGMSTARWRMPEHDARGRLGVGPAHGRRDLGRRGEGPQRARDQGPPAQRRLTGAPTFPPDPGTFTFAPEPFRCEGEGSGAKRAASPAPGARAALERAGDARGDPAAVEAALLGAHDLTVDGAPVHGAGHDGDEAGDHLEARGSGRR